MSNLKNSIFGILLGLGCLFPSSFPSLADSPETEPILSESYCTELATKLLISLQQNAPLLPEQMEWLNQCREQFWMFSNEPLPTKRECIDFFALTLSNFSTVNLRELGNTPLSLVRCPEVIEIRYMAAGSMEPTLHINDRLLVDKTAYHSQLPQRSDIILFEPTPTLREQNIQEPPAYYYGPVVVPPHHYFVLGDNRNTSYDSHCWGFVDQALISGQALAIVYPLNNFQILLNSAHSIDPDEAASLANLSQKISSFYSKYLNEETNDLSKNINSLSAKNYVASITRAQQAFYLEYGQFSSSLSELGLGIDSETANYNYNILATDDPRIIQNRAIAKNPGLKSYLGIAWVGTIIPINEMSTFAILCESARPTTVPPPQVSLPANPTQELSCPPGYSKIL